VSIQVGDRVKVDQRYSPYRGRKGYVTELTFPIGPEYPYARVELPNRSISKGPVIEEFAVSKLIKAN
jgi:hypothetical protein